MSHYRSYIICTSPRSGSTLLCRMLADTGIAGKPASLFYRPSIEDWLTRMNITPAETATERDSLAAILRAAIDRGTAGTGLFGLRQQRPSFPFLCKKLAVLYPDEPTDRARLHRAFGPTLFIHLTRHDKIEQAVSYLKAEQSGLWHAAPDGSELERLAPHRDPSYDRDQIRACVETMTDYDNGWLSWFDQEGISPLRISYKNLSGDPLAILQTILERLGLDPAAADGISPSVKKLADETSREWVARFRAEEELGRAPLNTP
ncbi:Stf0 family sulfotransferase [uncultured Roseibium sp.]|uniref:Stf0 family sulfotransferase n=1 Tax=uncultured Roseibium sp. TaxID=1936171 RepID=UPI00321727C5